MIAKPVMFGINAVGQVQFSGDPEEDVLHAREAVEDSIRLGRRYLPESPVQALLLAVKHVVWAQVGRRDEEAESRVMQAIFRHWGTDPSRVLAEMAR